MKQVTAAIIANDNKLLIARRKKGEHLEGFWEFPGGKVEEGETLQSCLERELFEEFGVKAEAGGTIAECEYRYEHGSFHIIAINTNIVEGEITLIVHDQIAWVPLCDILEYRLAPADVLLAKLIKGEI